MDTLVLLGDIIERLIIEKLFSFAVVVTVRSRCLMLGGWEETWTSAQRQASFAVHPTP